MNRCILIADDDAEDRFFYQKAFEENNIGDTVLYFQNGLELLGYLQDMLADKAHLPSLILLDVNMPKMNGKEVLKTIKANESLGVIPVVIVSTSSAQDDMDECYALGANEYRVKPGNFVELKITIGQLYDRWLR
ncbi:response regulator [Cytophagaceae bacterium YF14B1]|uniref:Response regulator n=1 Tax=Xanthocytophaga flava TaxID=3048013 RepID=A0AAE3UDN5_9BACT|nr:response regulator [Xanthocytophaga flavus]MDJ1485959.1 response regulator [Xanthocytophaga flavus]